MKGKDLWSAFGTSILESIHPVITVGGSPINTETSKNHSSISSSIQITSTNQSNITRGDKQKELSDIKKDKINTQTININPSKIIEKVM